MGMHSEAFDVVSRAAHPSPECGGPCATCAFRPGTEASRSPHTVELAKLCVEGIEPFDCHERPQLCRGWIAAVNLNGAPVTEADRQHVEMARAASDILGRVIDAAVDFQRAARTGEA